jgi:SAM-dependent methyltransferase
MSMKTGAFRMQNSASNPVAAYAVVGRYDQNRVNGFNPDLIEAMIESVDPASATEVLDAMAGDGNLTASLFDYCEKRGIRPPRMTLLEYSRVQSELSKVKLCNRDIRTIWGDILTMTARDTGAKIPEESFDRIMIKSANHEIPKDRQHELYESVFRMLKPGGLFVNLGMLFEDTVERDEFRNIARTKDLMAEMHDAVVNRHFLTRDEFYDHLRACGYSSCEPVRTFDYKIWSDIVRAQYFDRFKDRALELDLEHQVAQVRAHTLRRRGRIVFEGDRSAMFCPGEITAARKPVRAAQISSIYRKYAYDFVKHITVYRDMMNAVVAQISPRFRHLDLGCGNGYLAELLIPQGTRYVGIDISEQFVEACRERYGHVAGFSFEVADINEIRVRPGSFDSVSLVNVLYQAGMNAPVILRNAHDALRVGGRIVITGPISQQSFARAWPYMLRQLRADGLHERHREEIASIHEANTKLLTEKGNYWSAEGMVALLELSGFNRILRADNSLYYGNSFLSVAEK